LNVFIEIKKLVFSPVSAEVPISHLSVTINLNSILNTHVYTNVLMTYQEHTDFVTLTITK